MSYYKYYKPYNGETIRPDWLVFLDHLIEIGRLYPVKRTNLKEHEYLNEHEYRRLVSLLFQDNTVVDREEIMLSANGDEISLVIAGFVESDSKDAEHRISMLILQNIIHYFEPVLEDIFENIRDAEQQGIVSHE